MLVQDRETRNEHRGGRIVARTSIWIRRAGAGDFDLEEMQDNVYNVFVGE
jgi:hypothetical protein